MATPLRTKKNETAIDAYNARLAEVRKHLTRIQNALVNVDDNGKVLGEALNWGHVGDLAHLADELKDAANFITGDAE